MVSASNNNPTLVLADGTILCFVFANLVPYPYFIMIDVNGNKAPNLVGQDIFALMIFRDESAITAYGNGTSCTPQAISSVSPVAGNYNCSSYYLAK